MWDELKKVALVGTDKATLTAAQMDNAMRNLYNSIQTQDGEQVLLALAGALSLHDMAGFTPSDNAEQLPQTASDEALPECSEGAVQQLAMRLLERDFALMDEWVRLCAESGQCIPPKYAPALLANTHRQLHLHAALKKVTGERGRWLSEFASQWKEVFTEVSAEAWHADEYTTTQRYLTLKEWRETDAAAARESLMKHMGKFNAADRALFVSALEVNLSADDEEALEQLLDEKSRTVAANSAKLLSCLPDSDYVARMIDRVKDRVVIKPKLKKKPLKVHLYDVISTEMKRDTVNRNFDRASTEKERWFANMIATIPPTYWEQQTGLDAHALLTLASESSSHVQTAMFYGWEQAAINHRNHHWMRAALQRRMEIGVLNASTVNRRLMVEMIIREITQHFPSSEIENMVTNIMTDNTLKWMNLHVPLVCAFQWSLDYSEDVLVYLESVAKNNQQHVYTVSAILTAAVHYCHPDALSTAIALFPPAESKNYYLRTLNKAVDEFISTLKRRKDMWEAFSYDG